MIPKASRVLALKRSAKASLFLLMMPCAFAQVAINDLPCLYGVTVGTERVPVSDCASSDPLKLGEDSRIHSAMQILGIPRSAVRFRGCRSRRFSAVEDIRAGPAKEFILTYPSEVRGKVLAPVIHELAHVMQILHAVGINRLRAKWTSLQIELMADFLVGYVFARAFPDLNRDEFQHNLQLVGDYFDEPHEDHGNPAQRTAAFRLGAVNAYPYKELNAGNASRYFLDNDLSLVTGQ